MGYGAAIILLLGFVLEGEGSGQRAPVDFDREVAPLLAERCLDCHSGPKPKGGLDLTSHKATLAGGESGPALVAGKVDESELWLRVDEGEMPPKKPLAEDERKILKAWIASGASWGTDPIDPFRITTAKRAGYDWWSLRPIDRPELPQDISHGWGRTGVDAFIAAKLKEKGLEPSPEADRRTLIRRSTLDLIGLLPTPEEVEAFVKDTDPLAYERLVDRLLASPHYGERWARHWLDVARFGESDGFERNMPRQNAWHYRDWLIRAFNADLPYDDFCRMQVAGDVLKVGDPDAAKATGFLVAGVHNTTLGNDMMRAIARQDELEDIVGTFGQTFLGLTVNCARCHDHKFDPIAQKDFYRIASALGGVEHGERDFRDEVETARVEKLSAEVNAVASKIAEIDRPARRVVLAERFGASIPDSVPPSPVAAWDFRRGPEDVVGNLDLEATGGARFTPEGLVLDGKEAMAQSKAIGRDLKQKTLMAWVKVADLDQRGGGVISLFDQATATFDAIVFGELEPGRWMAGSENFRRTGSFHGPAETSRNTETVMVALAYEPDGTIAAYRDGQPYGRSYRSTGPAAFGSAQSVLLFGCRHQPAGGNRMFAGTIVQARLFDRALSADEVAAAAATSGAIIPDKEVVARLSPEARSRREALEEQRKKLAAERDEHAAKASYKAYVSLSGQAPVTRLLVRGQVTDPSEVIAPGGCSALIGKIADFGLPPEAPDAERRKKLAEWLTHATNPLFTRVMVNRIWHYHFGTGIVETPNDFGFNGGRPSHPELLDWLSAEFADSGYRVKAMHRLIMTSAAYRQAAKSNPKALAVDADNRLLWRKTPRRLEGEAVRDGILEVSGLLNRELGGKGFSDYREDYNNGTTYFDPFDPVGAPFHRRSVYRFQPRGANQGLLDTFDCPDPAATTPRRSMTTTPLQALTLWNNGFVLRAAEALGDRLHGEIPGPDDDAKILDRRIDRAWQLALQREPRPTERDSARAVVSAFGYRALARVLFNTNEFLTVE